MMSGMNATRGRGGEAVHVDVEHLPDRPDHAHERAERDPHDHGGAGAGEIDHEALRERGSEPPVEDEPPAGLDDREGRGEEPGGRAPRRGPPDEDDEAEKGEPQQGDAADARPPAGGGLRPRARRTVWSLIGHAHFSAIPRSRASGARRARPPPFG